MWTGVQKFAKHADNQNADMLEAASMSDIECSLKKVGQGLAGGLERCIRANTERFLSQGLRNERTTYDLH